MILDKLTAIVKKEEHNWRKTDYRQAFILPMGHEKFLKTAKSWASGYRNKYSKDQTPEENRYAQIDDIDNSPQKLTIIDLYRRSSGGRAYQVLTEQGWQVDLRESEL